MLKSRGRGGDAQNAECVVWMEGGFPGKLAYQVLFQINQTDIV